MDHDLDAKNVSEIVTTFTKFFHPDKINRESNFYKCILNKGRDISRAIEVK